MELSDKDQAYMRLLEDQLKECRDIIKEQYSFYLKVSEKRVTPEIATAVSILYRIMDKLGLLKGQE